MDFDTAFTRLIGNEGGYVNNPADPGGETKYGICKRDFPGEDIKGLTLDRAKQIYRERYWGPAGCDAWPPLLKFEVFDMAVNHGVKTAITLLQRVVGAADDGVIGPQTTMLVQSADQQRALRQLTARRLRYYTSLKTFPTFGAGWVNRVAANLERA